MRGRDRDRVIVLGAGVLGLLTGLLLRRAGSGGVEDDHRDARLDVAGAEVSAVQQADADRLEEARADDIGVGHRRVVRRHAAAFRHHAIVRSGTSLHVEAEYASGATQHGDPSHGGSLDARQTLGPRDDLLVERAALRPRVSQQVDAEGRGYETVDVEPGIASTWRSAGCARTVRPRRAAATTARPRRRRRFLEIEPRAGTARRTAGAAQGLTHHRPRSEQGRNDTAQDTGRRRHDEREEQHARVHPERQRQRKRAGRRRRCLERAQGFPRRAPRRQRRRSATAARSR